MRNISLPSTLPQSIRSCSEINVVVLGLLFQLVSQQSSVLKTHKPTLTCFSLLVFFYAVLWVSEAIDVNRRFGVTARLVGRTSHLLGGLTASVLISVVCTKLAFVLLILWFCWFSFVAYNTFNEIKINNSRANNTEADSPVRRRFDNSWIVLCLRLVDIRFVSKIYKGKYFSWNKRHSSTRYGVP